MDSKIIICLLLILLLPACNHNDPPEKPTHDANIGILKKVVNAEQFEDYIKNGLRVPSSSGVIDFVAESTIAFSADTPSTTQTTVSADSATATATFSTTNTQEQNVDESDIIKYDGEFLYIATTPEYSFVTIDAVTTTGTSVIENTSGIRVMRRTSAAEMTEIAWPKLDETSSIDTLYLHQDSLVSIGYGFGSYSIVPVLYDAWYWGEPKTALNFFDVSTPASINRTHTMQIDGYLETSRRIENTLYLVTRYTPYLPQLDIYQLDSTSDTDIIIQQASIEDLLPQITINDQAQTLVEPTDCYLPENVKTNDGYASLIVITAIDISQPDSFSSVCFNAMSQGIYTSANAMYISASSLDDETVIHKFSLQSGSPAYSASGFIEGNLGWRNPAFRMSEHENHLRIISTKREGFNDFIHQLYVLKDNGHGTMEQVSTLPNEILPEKIGKPGEDITAVRYYGARAYVVTFEQTDPLYVINLENQASPFIAGSLEIPGFSSYLHPVNDDLLLGMGWDNGVKLSLFDVADLANPLEVSNFIWSDAYSPIQDDYKALAFLEITPGHYRFSFPVNQYFWTNTATPPDNGLHLFDLVTDTTGSMLTQSGIISTAQLDYSYRDRSIIQNDEVFYVHGNHVWSAPWSLDSINADQ